MGGLIRFCTICHVEHILVIVDNIKSDTCVNKDIFQFFMGAKPSKGVLEQTMLSYIIPTKLESDRLELLFHSHFVCISCTLRTGIK